MRLLFFVSRIAEWQKSTFILALTILTLFLPACQKFDLRDHFGHHPHTKGPDAQVAVDWYKLQLNLLRERNSTLNAPYFAYLGIGLYESVQPGLKNAVSLSTKLYQMPEMPATEHYKTYDWEVSANAAMAALLRSYNTGLTPANMATIDSLESAYNEKLKPGTPTSVFTRSQEFGRSVASAVYNWSLTDNFNASNAGYVPPVFPGAWVPTPPAFANGIQPYLSAARPLLAATSTIIVKPFPSAFSEDPKSDFYKIVRNVYDVSQNLTPEQKDIAMFWVDQGNGVGFTPGGHQMSIVTQAIVQKKADLGTAAEVYAKAGIAERELTIVCFSAKYKYNQIRPVSYIRKLIDTAWMPFIVTPPHPEYPGAHGFITGGVMTATEKVLGDHLKITDHTYDFRGWKPRTFKSLFAAGEEAGISRLYGGIHYLPSINTGLSLGRELGSEIGNLKLRY